MLELRVQLVLEKILDHFVHVVVLVAHLHELEASLEIF